MTRRLPKLIAIGALTGMALSASMAGARSLEPLQFNDEYKDCEYSFYPADSKTAPLPKILQISVYEKPSGVIRRHGARQELAIDQADWESLSRYKPGRHRLVLSGADITIVVSFTLDHGDCDAKLSDPKTQSCMYGLEGSIKILTPKSKGSIAVRGAAGC